MKLYWIRGLVRIILELCVLWVIPTALFSFLYYHSLPDLIVEYKVERKIPWGLGDPERLVGTSFIAACATTCGLHILFIAGLIATHIEYKDRRRLFIEQQCRLGLPLPPGYEREVEFEVFVEENILPDIPWPVSGYIREIVQFWLRVYGLIVIRRALPRPSHQSRYRALELLSRYIRVSSGSDPPFHLAKSV